MRDIRLTLAFADTIKELRREHNLTQDKLADMIDTERSHISTLERAKQGPSIELIITVAKVFNMTPGSLLDSIVSRMES